MGFEPTTLAGYVPETYAYSNFATAAKTYILTNLVRYNLSKLAILLFILENPNFQELIPMVFQILTWEHFYNFHFLSNPQLYNNSKHLVFL